MLNGTTLSAAQFQAVLNAAYIAEGNGDVNFDEELRETLNGINKRFDRFVTISLPMTEDEDS
jgi:hypothetical protein